MYLLITNAPGGPRGLNVHTMKNEVSEWEPLVIFREKTLELTQGQLAEKVGVREKSISEYENDRKPMGGLFLRKMAMMVPCTITITPDGAVRFQLSPDFLAEQP